ncbi:HTH domain-containing protein, partial [Tetragenococcus halophilus]
MALNVSNLEFKLLQILIEKDQYQSVNSIAEQLNFSRRSTYYYMKSVSEKLIKNKIDPPRNVKGQGYYLSKQSKEQLNIIFSTDNYKNVYKKQEKKFS